MELATTRAPRASPPHHAASPQQSTIPERAKPRGVPTKSVDFVGKGDNSKRCFLPLDCPRRKGLSRLSCGKAIASVRVMSEPRRSRRGEGYGACDDACTPGFAPAPCRLTAAKHNPRTREAPWGALRAPPTAACSNETFLQKQDFAQNSNLPQSPPAAVMAAASLPPGASPRSLPPQPQYS